VNLALFLFAFKVLTSAALGWRQLLPGTVLAGVAWTILQVVGGYYVTHQLKSASQVYGTLALVIGLLSWLYLGAQLFIYSAELNVVVAKHLFPRSMFPPPLTEGDKRGISTVAKVDELRPEATVEVDFESQPDGAARDPGAARDREPVRDPGAERPRTTQH